MSKSTTTRIPLSKSLRFEVFRRDGFVCQYCGQRPPDVVLEIDHITPVSKGGTNDVLNLVTACFDCNRGKRNRDLADRKVYPDADVEFLATQQEVVELQRYQKAKNKRDRVLKKVISELQDLWCEVLEDDYCPTDGQMRRWIVWAGPEVVEHGICASGYKARELYNMYDRLRFVGAVIRNTLNQQSREGGDV